MRLPISIALALVCAVAPSIAQEDPAGAARRKTFDEFLDLYVRDGYVYYRALRSERSRFDAYVNSLAGVQIDALSRDEQVAFWLNAYNALVLRTVIDHYPIQGRSPDYPPKSIRQIPGAFERLPDHRGPALGVVGQRVEPALDLGHRLLRQQAVGVDDSLGDDEHRGLERRNNPLEVRAHRPRAPLFATKRP